MLFDHRVSNLTLLTVGTQFLQYDLTLHHFSSLEAEEHLGGLTGQTAGEDVLCAGGEEDLQPGTDLLLPGDTASLVSGLPGTLLVLPPDRVQLRLSAGEETLAGIVRHQLQHQLGRHLLGDPQYQSSHVGS